jgi:hypothetical protein
MPKVNDNSISLRKQVLWGNNNILFKGKSLWCQSWINSNIVIIDDLFSSDGKMDRACIYSKLCNTNNWIAEMFMIQNAIPNDWLATLNSNGQWSTCIGKQHPTKFFCKGVWFDLLESSISTKYVHRFIVQQIKTRPLYKSMWEQCIGQEIFWLDVYMCKLVRVKEVKMLVFNYKLLNNILASGVKLKQWRIYENECCHLCFAKGDTVHMICRCPYFTNYYVCVKDICAKMGLSNVNFDLKTLICGYKPFDPSYCHVNDLINIIFYTVYKANVMLREDRNNVNPIALLKYELRLRDRNNLVNQFVNLM